MIYDILHIVLTLITIVMKFYVIRVCLRVLKNGVMCESEYGSNERTFYRWF